MPVRLLCWFVAFVLTRIIYRVLCIEMCLCQCTLSYEHFSLCERDICGCGSVSLFVGDDLDGTVLVDTHRTVLQGGKEKETHALLCHHECIQTDGAHWSRCGHGE